MSHLEDQKKIALLEEYVLTLERENFAKNGQTRLLYEQLQSVKEENEMLKSFIETMRSKWDEEKTMLTQQLQAKEEEELTNYRNFGEQLRNSVDISSLKAVAEDMRVELQVRETEISQLMSQKGQLQEEVGKLRLQLTQATCRSMKSQEKVRHQMQFIKQLENEVYGLKNSRTQSRTGGVSFAKFEVDKLVKQNNQLIQKVRLLQRQKNQYYQQLKMASPLKSRHGNKENKSAQNKNQGKSERWNAMEQKLRAIRNQNQQLKANLAII